MSKSHILRNLGKKEEQAAKEEEKGYVRAEKAADEAISKKLEEKYGSGPAMREDGRRNRAWRCRECGFANWESRLACASCLAVAPRTNKDGTPITPPPNVAEPPRSNDSAAVLTKVGERVYRSWCNHDAAMKRALAVAAAPAAAQYPRAGAAAHESGSEPDEPGCDGGDQAATCGASGSTGAGRVTYDDAKRRFVLRAACPRRYHRFVVGTAAKTLKDIERSTMTKVTVPRSTDKSNPDAQHEGFDEEDDAAPALELDPVKDFVVIDGDSATAVEAAALRIEAIMAEAKDKVEYTHFLSIPLGPIPSAKAAFTSLIDDMKQAAVDEEKAIDASIFQKPARVHVTLLMLRLYSQAELNTAKLLLESLEPELQHIFSPNDAITLRGLATMNADVRAAHVVYMDVVKDGVFKRLQALVNRINNAFIDAGLAKPKDVQNNGKLHATIMNSKWRRGRAHQPFNAADVIRMFGDRAFGTHRLRSIEVNVLGGGSAPDGYFTSVASIGFP